MKPPWVVVVTRDDGTQTVWGTFANNAEADRWGFAHFDMHEVAWGSEPILTPEPDEEN